MKDTLVVGDSLDFVTALPDYRASDGYTLTYRLVPRVSGTPITITASASGDEHRVQVYPATTAAWTPGEYTWSAWVSKTDERITVDSGLCTILADPATIAAYDGRSQAQVALEAATAALATYTSSGGRIKRYAIGGRELEYQSSADLVKEVSYWQGVVNREQAAEAIRRGQADPRRVYIRMGGHA